MNKMVALQILAILDSLDERVSQIESHLEGLQIEDNYFSGWGSDSSLIGEVRKLVTDYT